MTTDPDAALLARLNRLSLTRSFTPELDVDWAATTTEAEFAALYPAWSLLVGTGLDGDLDEADRATFARYQQINLMAFTGLLERHAIGTLASLYDLDPAQPFSEYLGHFLKEEIYHYTLFNRAIAAIQATMPGRPPLPVRAVDRLLRWVFRGAALLPGRRLRVTVTFMLIRFAEQVTIFAHQTAQARIARRESLVCQVWAFHALDESRHLAFDELILERNRLPRLLAWLPVAAAAPGCVLLSLFLNANEVWIARSLGLRVSLWQLPRLLRTTQAPFKRRVFGLLAATLRPSARKAADDD